MEKKVKTKTKTVKRAKKPKILVLSGKRKRAVAKATIRDGSGKVTINRKALETFPYLQKLFMKEPLILTEKVVPGVVGKVDISLNVRGSGTESQTEACRLAIARALVEFTKSKQVRDAFINYDRSLLVADVRRKEACKPGISKARAKRQKSYR